MSTVSKISLHPRLAGVIDGLISVVFLWAIRFIHEWWMVAAWALARYVLWAILLRFVYYAPQLKKRVHFFSLFLFALGSTLLIIFADWRWSYIFSAVIWALLPALSFWLLPRSGQNLSFISKPARRVELMLTSIGLAGLWAGSAASIVFHIFSGPPWWQWVVGAGIATIAAIVWWQEYNLTLNTRLIPAAICLFLLVLEYSWVLSWWSIGYLTSGLLQIWWWYILWQLLRFYLSAEGIFFRRQGIFLAINGLFFLFSLLFIIRWK